MRSRFISVGLEARNAGERLSDSEVIVATSLLSYEIPLFTIQSSLEHVTVQYTLRRIILLPLSRLLLYAVIARDDVQSWLLFCAK